MTEQKTPAKATEQKTPAKEKTLKTVTSNDVGEQTATKASKAASEGK